MPGEVYQPLIRYFEAAGHSLQYAIASRPGWSLVEKTKALRWPGYCSVMWMLPVLHRVRRAGRGRHD